MALSLTEKAAFRLRTFLRSSRAQEETPTPVGVRLAVVDGGCSGYEYSLDITSTPKPDDVVFEEDKVLFYIDRQSAPLLEGIVIDFVEGLTQSGFKFLNPNATESCGCGKSFKAGDCTPAAAPCS
ncbi:HesB/IscA family protein [Kamptonema formosum]|uniref:HesB/IscA family protein n=1 Tax=Kamptonema formosum TaxID=331992 RepID=UPI00034B41D8|nr:iron-sulfur cluster assembly accessory protein [Oscillatoria sp. PCC 10802]